jgi:hypothetical protein
VGNCERGEPERPVQGGLKKDNPKNLGNFIVQKFSQIDYVQIDHANDRVRNVQCKLNGSTYNSLKKNNNSEIRMLKMLKS